MRLSGKAEVSDFSLLSATSKGLRLLSIVGVQVTLFPQLFNLLVIEYDIACARSVQLILFLGYD